MKHFTGYLNTDLRRNHFLAMILMIAMTAPVVNATETAIVALPSAPTLIAPAQNATGVPATIILMWAASSGATCYHVQVSTNPTFATKLVNDSSVTTTSFIVGPLMNNTVYYWKVNARNTSGISACTGGWKFTTGTVGALPAEFPQQGLTLVNGEFVRFSLLQKAHVVIRLFSSEGRMISQLLDETRNAGDYTAALPAGFQNTFCFLDFTTGNIHRTMKIHP